MPFDRQLNVKKVTNVLNGFFHSPCKYGVGVKTWSEASHYIKYFLDENFILPNVNPKVYPAIGVNRNSNIQ